jgi:hypothetical protein
MSSLIHNPSVELMEAVNSRTAVSAFVTEFISIAGGKLEAKL